jgi:hypothetical protein
MGKTKLDKETKQCSKLFYESTLTENEFVGLLLPYLGKRGIRTITEEELSKKLFPYYLDENYNILFTDIVKASYGDKVDITNGMYNEKYFSRDIMWTSNNPAVLHLLYKSNDDMQEYEKDFKPEIIALLNSIADDLGVRNKIETSRLNIYGYDPNKNYSILEARHFGSYELELITDGNIQLISDCAIKPRIFYPDPSGYSECRTYEEGIYRNITIENASYAITQGTYNGEIKKVEVFTKVSELEKLRKISEMASSIHNDDESLLVSDRPYVEN